MDQTVNIRVKGKVQGVFYRQQTRRFAVGKGIRGFVENQPDGSVFITATATRELLDELIAWCAHGPDRAEVIDVSFEKVEYLPFADFSIRKN